MKLYFWCFVLLLINFGCAQNKSKHITEFSQKDINDGILVDVRTPKEYAAGHIKNAVNINWFDTDFTSQFERFGKNKTIYVYCKKGGRSLKAQEKLKSLGYENVINLEGGYDAKVMHQK
ncbi:rhodanese-like domain-containing protein [Costertonia aggregata]|uniref:Rhodanese-like domain-containing protein n=1 Tax=Costertonia aggregata TaxID=343403 RepID=A0A7H9AS31_9FLAO|nr:rhodanese-like domain-containing protein [Costertonia aggregata]QLG45995.1 rhodanese-like domain-containing protein [Costertonia aggregata]